LPRMKVGGQEVNDKIIARIQETIDKNAGLSRSALSRRICEELKWRSRNGRWREVRCRVVLLELEKRERIRLPAAAKWECGGKKLREIREDGMGAATAMEGPLSDLQPVEVVPVGRADSEESGVWNDLMRRHHYLGAGPLCGAQMRYLIRSSKQAWLGGLSFSAPAWRVEARDGWIGWSSEAREQNLKGVVGNSRFLILPHVRVPHLASHVLGLAMRRLRGDWKQRYGEELLLVETYIEQQRFEGTCYRAANFIEVGQTQGRGRQDRRNRRAAPVKRIFVYAWETSARQRLCEVDGEIPRPAMKPTVGGDWAETEFAGARLGDERLQQRLIRIARDLYAHPGCPIPQACQSRSKTKATYRFFQHENTEMDILLEPHYASTQRRIAEHRIVLSVQDTTSLNYSTQPTTEGLGPIGSDADGALGLVVHDTMAFTLEGTPLGLMDVQCWARNGAEFGKKHQRKKRPIDEKESRKWLESFKRVAEAQRQCPSTTLVSVGDAEADVYELMAMALKDPQGPRLLIRAKQPRLLMNDEGLLWETMKQRPVTGIQEIQLPRRHPRPARQARLEVRYGHVTLKPPGGKSQYGALTLWAVLALETGTPEKAEPVEWMLLTTMPITTFEQATQKLAWYSRRFLIEVYHRTLKTGCKVEQRQLGTADRIEACLAIDMVVAWRIYQLAKLGRETPHVPCTVYFEESEWKALHAWTTKNPELPEQPPTLYQAMRDVASLGGFLGRKGDGEPGAQTLWRGLQRLDGMAVMWEYMANTYAPHLVSTPVSRGPT
jgi:hypothetical protein